jgi:hypothetical protein
VRPIFLSRDSNVCCEYAADIHYYLKKAHLLID